MDLLCFIKLGFSPSFKKNRNRDSFLKSCCMMIGGVYGNSKSGLQCKWGSGKEYQVMHHHSQKLNDHLYCIVHTFIEFKFYLPFIPSDLDIYIPRPKPPKTALPNDVRAKLGLKKRSVVGRQSNMRDGMENNPALYKIETRKFLKKGRQQCKKRQSLSTHHQTMAWKNDCWNDKYTRIGMFGIEGFNHTISIINMYDIIKKLRFRVCKIQSITNTYDTLKVEFPKQRHKWRENQLLVDEVYLVPVPWRTTSWFKILWRCSTFFGTRSHFYVVVIIRIILDFLKQKSDAFLNDFSL